MTPAAAPGVQDAAAAGYHLLRVPTPFAVGAVNCVLVDDDPLTLVDCGPNWGTSLEALTALLAAHGKRLEDVERLVITHQHADHLGLAGIVAARSGAEVCALDLLAPVLEDYAAHAARDDGFTAAVMRRHGIDDELVTAIRAIARAFAGLGSSARVDRRLHDGDTLAFAGREWVVHHRPGHSPSDTIFHDAAAGVVLAGDHVLSHISSNPVLSRPLGGLSGDPDAGRPQPLLRYRESLAATRAMADVAVVLGGHGDPVVELAPLLDSRDRATDKRAAKILRALREDGPLTAHAVARRLWGDTALTQPLLTLSEAVGHLDLLASRGEAAEDASGAVVTWTAP